MKKFIFTLLFLSSLFSASANAQTCMGRNYSGEIDAGTDVLCSATWLFSNPNATCNGQDLVYTWSIAGTTTPLYWNIQPWETSPITIRGIELTINAAQGATIWWMAGNNYTPDAMIWIGPGKWHGRVMYPAGMGMPFPGIGAPASSYLDLHGACNGGGTVTAFYTIYYTVKRP